MTHQDHKDLTDQELLDRFYQSGENHWLGILLERYTLLLLGVGLKYLHNEEDARDCVQQVFMKALDELHKYKVYYIKSWLYLVAKNQCLMKLRAQKGKKQVELNDREFSLEAEFADIDFWREKDRMLQQLETGLQQLNAEQKQCVTLFYLENKSYAEISIQTGFTLLQVKSHIQNGKRNLRLFMERQPELDKNNE